MKKIYALFFLSFIFNLALAQTEPVCFTNAINSGPTTGAEHDMVVMDWNGDGAKDYIVVNADSNKVYVRLNPGAGSRAFAYTDSPVIQTIYDLANPFEIEAVDMDADGIKDLIVHHRNGPFDSVKVICPNGAGGIQYVKHMGLVGNPTFIRIDDVNNDSSPDILAFTPGVGSGTSVATFMNDGLGNMASNTGFTIPWARVRDAAFADNDSDGDAEMYIAAEETVLGTDTAKAIVYENTTIGATFGYTEQFRQALNPVTSYSGAYQVLAGDFNYDGLTDFYINLMASNITMGMFFNGGSYNAVMLGGYANANSIIKIVDMNNDGAKDFVTLDPNGNIFINTYDGSPNYGPAQSTISLTQGNYTHLEVADLDSDSYQDILVCSAYNAILGQGVRVLFSNGQPYLSIWAGNGPDFCLGSVTPYTFAATWNNPQVTFSSPSYSWSVGGTNDTITYLAATTTTLTLNSTAGSCDFSANITLNIIDPTFELGADFTGCAPFAQIGPVSTPNTSYSWSSNPPGFSSSNNIEFIPSGGGTVMYYLNTFNTLIPGCTHDDSVLVDLLQTPVIGLGNPTTSCNFSPVGISTASETNTTYSWTSNPPGYTDNTNSILVTPGAPIYYILQATNTITSCVSTDSMYVYSNGSPSLIGGGTYPTCQGDSLAIGHILTPAGGTPPYSLNWWYGAGTVPDAGINTMYFPTTAVNFSVSIVDVNGCTQGFTSSFSVPYTDSTNKDLVGHVTTPLPADVTNGLVYIFSYHPGNALDSMGTAPLDANGKYVFTALDNDDYLIKVIPDQTAYPLSIPTYYGNDFQWDSSLVVSHGCLQIDTADIQILELPTGTGSTGTGFISGYIIEGYGFGDTTSRLGPGIHPNVPFAPGGPLKGIDVKLGKNPGGGIQARVMTDTTGYYSFDSLPLVGYKIYVDIPNLPMDSTRTVDLGPGPDAIYQNNYYADSTHVYILDSTVAVGIYASTKIYENNFTIFPNPVGTDNYLSTLNIKLDTDKTGDINITLMNTLGQNVYVETVNNNSKGTFTHSIEVSTLHLKAGVYFISVINDNKKYTQRLVVVE